MKHTKARFFILCLGKTTSFKKQVLLQLNGGRKERPGGVTCLQWARTCRIHRGMNVLDALI
jgi:hypothetical protein